MRTVTNYHYTDLPFIYLGKFNRGRCCVFRSVNGVDYCRPEKPVEGWDYRDPPSRVDVTKEWDIIEPAGQQDKYHIVVTEEAFAPAEKGVLGWECLTKRVIPPCGRSMLYIASAMHFKVIFRWIEGDVVIPPETCALVTGKCIVPFGGYP